MVVFSYNGGSGSNETRHFTLRDRALEAIVERMVLDFDGEAAGPCGSSQAPSVIAVKGQTGAHNISAGAFTEIPHQSGHQHRQFLRNSRSRSYALCGVGLNLTIFDAGFGISRRNTSATLPAMQVKMGVSRSV